MADLARRAPRWVGTLSDGNVHVKFHDDRWEMAEILHIEISWKHVSVTYDLDLWPKILKYLSVTEYPYSMCMLSFMMIGWEMTEILHFEILRKHGQTNTQTHKHTNTHNTQTNRHGHYNTSPSPYGGRGKYVRHVLLNNFTYASICIIPNICTRYILQRGPNKTPETI